MNKIHSKVWNKELGQLVVASEFASSDSAGVVQGAGAASVLRGSVLAAVVASLLAVAGFGPAAFAQEWTVTDGTTPAMIGDGGTVTVQGDGNINVEQTGSDGAAVLAITLDPDLVVDSVTTGTTVMNSSGVAVGANVMLGSTGLVINGGPSVTTAGINAGNAVITNVAAGGNASDAVNFGQLDAVSDELGVAQGAISDHATAIATNAGNIATNTADIATNAADIAINTADIDAVRATASAGWDISAEGGTAANVGSGGAVDFSGDGNIEVARTGTNLTFSLADDIEVQSITAGSAAFGSDGLTIAGGPSVTSTGIDAGGLAITNMAPGAVALGSAEAITGGQVYNYFIEEGATGVRYFRATSAEPDAVAGGAESIAIGPNTVSVGDSSLAAGDGAETTEEGVAAIALGQGAVAGGADPSSGGEGAIAIGRASAAGGTGSVALGDGARATAGDATALGAGAQAGGGNSIAIGGARAASGNSLAAGEGAYAGSIGGIALGTGAGVNTNGVEAGDRDHHIAIGTGAGRNVAGNQTTAIGYEAGSDVSGLQNVAIGSHAGANLQGNYNVAIGHEANRNAGSVENATAIGAQSDAARDGAAVGYGAQAADTGVAMGSQSSAGEGGVALGRNAQAEGSHVALGIGSAARSSDAQGAGYLTGSDFTDGQVVSVGNSNLGGEQRTRRIVNVSDGSQGYDAVNVRQLQQAQDSVATLVGGGVTRNADGSYSTITVDVVGGGTAEFNTVVEAIGAVTSGAVDILPVDAVRYNAEGGISNVAAGTAATDAVNVQQLNEAVAENGVKYFSVNSEIVANRNNASASGMNAMAVGPAASAGGRSSLAAGHLSHTVGEESVALGYEVEALGDNSTVVGSSSTAYHDGGVAIGLAAESHGENSIVMGTRAHSHPKTTDETVNNAIVIGTDAEATADNGIAVGQSALASELRAVAQGYDAHAVADDAMAFGSNSRASGVSSQASGTGASASGMNAQASGTAAHASGYNAIASGTGATGYARDGIAIGTGAEAGFDDLHNDDPYRNTGGIAIGDSALADNHHALALGVDASAEAESATAIGDSAVATEDAEDGLAVGSSARVTAQNASAFGRGAEAVAEDALAVGSGARASGQSASAVGHAAEASATNASAFGQGARARHEGSVALGSGAETAAAVGTASYTVDKNTYSFAGTAPVATVSVGAPGQERTVTNVAAGRISAQSTDAINGSQLYSTNQAVDALADDLDTAGRSVATALGGTSVYDPDTHTVTAGLSVRGNNYTNVQDALDYVGQGWDVSAQGGAAQNVAPGGQVDFSNQDGNINIARTGTNLAFNLDDDLTIGNSITVGGTVINGTSVTTTNLTAGGETRLGDNFVVNSNGEAIYNGSEIATQDDGLSFAGNTGGTISKTLGDNTPLTISGELAATEATTGANLRVDSDGNQLNLVMARNLTDLDSITINNGPVISSTGIDMGNTRITNLAPGQAGTDAVNVNQLNDVAQNASAGWNVLDEEGNEANIGPDGDLTFIAGNDNLTVELSDDTDDASVMEITLADNIELTEDGSLAIGDGTDGSTLDAGGLTVVDGGNETTIGAGTVSVTDGAYTTSIGPTEVSVGGANPIVISGDAGTIGGLTNRTFNPNAIVNGQAATEDQLGQVYAVANAGWNVSAEGANVTNVGVNSPTGNSVDLNNSDDNIVISKAGDSNDVTFDLADDITIGNTITVGDTIIDGDSITTTNLTVEGDTHLGDHFTVNDGGAYYDGDITENTHIVNKEYVDNAVGDLAGTPMTFAGDAGTDVDRVLGETVNLVGGADESTLTDGNIGVVADGTDTLEIKLNKDIDLGEDGSLAIGDTELDNDGLMVDDGAGNVTTVAATGTTVTDGNATTSVEAGVVTVTANPTTGPANTIVIDANTGTIGGLANQTIDYPGFADGSGRAATEEQLSIVNETANAGWNLTDAEDNEVNIGPNGLVTFEGDNNITVTQTGEDQDGVIEVILNRDLDVDSVTAGDTIIDTTGVAVGDDVHLGSTGLVIDGGPSVTVAGIDAGALRITNVSQGVDGTDAVNVDQLNTLANTPLTFAGDAGDNVDRLLGETVNLVGGADESTLTDGNIGVVADGTDTLEIKLNKDIDLGEDGSLAIGDTELDNDGLEVDDGAGNVTTVAATGTTVTDGNATTSVEAGVVTVTANPTTGPANTIVIDANTGTIGGLTNTEFDPDVTYTGGLAATQEQLSQVNSDLTTAGLDFVGDDGTVVHRDLGDQLSITGGATGALSEGNIGVTANTAGDGLVVELADNIELTEDGSLTIGDAELDNDGLVVVDDAGNETTVGAAGTTVDDGAGNTTTVAATGTTVTDGNATTSVEAGVVTVTANPTTGPANTIVIDANTGTIGGLANQTIDYQGFGDGSGRAATEEQLAQVNETANMGWNISAQGENGTNVGPGGSVDLSNTDGNIVVAKADDSNDVTFDLADDLVIGNSITAGDTFIDTTGVAIGTDVHLGNTGLVINGGPSVTLAGIDAGNLVITNVAPGEISATSTDAINGSQLHGMGDSIVNVIGGNAELNPDGTIVTSDIGGTGHDNIDDAIRSANDAANAGWTATDADGNAANIGPDGSVAFTGDGNISVAQTGDDNSGEIGITLNRDLDVDSITAGDTVIDSDGVRVGDDVHLGDTGLVIEGGPSVTTDGIDAGGSVITNVAAGVNDTDAANVGQLNQVAGDVNDLGDRMDVVEGDVADLQAGATGPFQVSQEAPLVPPTPTGANAAAGGSGADASGDNSTALGNQAVASGGNSTAVGQGAQATHDNSVALGQGSATTVGAQAGYDAAYVGSSSSSGEVNVGNRTVSGVAPGVAGTDAVNVNQLNAGVNHAVVSANEYTDQRFNQVQGDVWNLHGRVDDLEKSINSGVATAMAMRQAPYVAGATTYFAGFGAYKDQGALGVSLRRTSDNGRWSLEGGFSANRDGAGGYVGVSGVLGSK